MHKGINYPSNFGRVSIVLGGWVFRDDKQTIPSPDQTPFATGNTQTINNNTDTVLNSGGDVSVKQPPLIHNLSCSEHAGAVHQQIKDNNSIAINVSGGVSTTFQEN